MEQDRESKDRGGHPGGDAGSEWDRHAPARYFEGMNYEQRREPYFTNRQQSNRQNVPENLSRPGENSNEDHAPL